VTRNTDTRSLALARRSLADRFAQAGIESAEADARLLIAHALDVERATVMTHGERLLSDQEMAAIDALAVRRLRREPVARIVGSREFWSLSLTLTPDVLVPRPDTETVVEAALDTISREATQLEPLRLLDIGTGSGALLLALLSELPNATGTGTDISTAALDVARANAMRHALETRCSFVACNIAAGVQGRFDLIVSNPPYVARADLPTLDAEVRNYDPALALDGGEDGLDFYRAIAVDVRRLLADGGRLIVELGAGQEPAVRSIFTDAGLAPDAAYEDLARIPRALHACMAP
jgi:release factor glutamine methyltransferase